MIDELDQAAGGLAGVLLRVVVQLKVKLMKRDEERMLRKRREESIENTRMRASVCALLRPDH